MWRFYNAETAQCKPFQTQPELDLQIAKLFERTCFQLIPGDRNGFQNLRRGLGRARDLRRQCAWRLLMIYVYSGVAELH